MSALTELRSFWLTNEKTYEDFAALVREKVARRARREGIQCEVTSRAKSLDSLLKKVVRKHYTKPLEEITDKAGVRVLLLYQDHRQAVVDLLHELFVVLSCVDKRLTLEDKSLGYSGYHCDVKLPDNDAVGELEIYRDLRCEVQIQTRAQNAWSEATHDLQYKAETKLPEALNRRINILSALTELFDEELSRERHDVLSIDGFKEAQVLAELEKPFYRLNDHTVDRQLSLQVVAALLSFFEDKPAEIIGHTVSEFVDAHRGKIERIYRTYEAYDEADYVFVNQPEGLLLFYLIELDRYAIADVWVDYFPRELLEAVVIAWGYSLD